MGHLRVGFNLPKGKLIDYIISIEVQLRENYTAIFLDRCIVRVYSLAYILTYMTIYVNTESAKSQLFGCNLNECAEIPDALASWDG